MRANEISAQVVHETLARHQLADGMQVVLDLDQSEGCWIHDARSGEKYMDAFTCFGSWPVGYNHPMLREKSFIDELLRSGTHNPSNSDLYTCEMARFVEAFASHMSPEEMRHHFWIAGGGLAVENALKVAFDWKARRLGRTSFHDDVNDLVVLHFTHAFHGRTGYTMSLTNTLPDKVGLFPKFDWPRVHSPFMEFDGDGNISNDVEQEEGRTRDEIEAVYASCASQGRHVAAIIIEPMQGEGGDRHFRPEFLTMLREMADEHDSLLVFDEVQTGFWGSGRPWLWQHKGVEPDIFSFGKKSQVCGICAGPRIDEVDDHVFVHSSRINSTWGGNLVDMVRCRRFIEIIDAENLGDNISVMGERMLSGLRSLAREADEPANVRGIGSLVAFSFPTTERRDEILQSLFNQKVLALPCGTDSIRFRLPLVITGQEVDELLSRLEAALSTP